MNDLFRSLGNRSNVPGNLNSLVNQFNQFRQSFKGNPQQQVQQLLNSGRMSQEQFNQLKKMADQLQNLLK